MTEGDAGTGKAPVAVTLTQPAIGGEQFTIATGGGSAIPGVDYRPKTKTVTLKPGQRQVYFTVQVYGNEVRTSDRTIGVTLSGVTGASRARQRHDHHRRRRLTCGDAAAGARGG